MAFVSFRNVKVAGISAGVPSNVIDNMKGGDRFSAEYSPADFIETTGVHERRWSNSLTTSDLSVAAAERLISDLQWDKQEIEALVFVSQTADYVLPATSCIIQDRLGLSKECFTLDISLGCSGWVHGMSVVASLMQNGTIKKALLLAGDAKARVIDSDPLFGHAGTATAIEYKEGEEGFKFHFGTDGSGYDAIIIPDGGARNGISEHSFDEEVIEGKTYSRLQDRMKGMDVFSFGISTAPKSVKKLAEHNGFDYLDYDFFVFHQANMKMNNMIAKKLKLDAEKVPSSMAHFGNTSSASIPITIVTELKKQAKGHKKFICCGFGVGLSWGTIAFDTNNLIISDLVEVDEEKGESKWV
jgi:3-oxoacyl-[acyl-carrier-protein] synthase-3